MNQTAKQIIRVAALTVGVAAAAWALRDRFLPTPHIPDEPPPRFRKGTAQAPSDLTRIKGVGAAYATRLREAGITTYDQLASADVVDIAAVTGISEALLTEWAAAAAALV